MGLDRILDSGSKAEPVDGQDRGADLQLVETVLENGVGAGKRRGADGQGAISAWDCAADQACGTEQAETHEHARKGLEIRTVTGPDQ